MEEDKRNAPLKLAYIKTLGSFLKPPGAWPSNLFGGNLSMIIRAHRVTLPFHTTLIVFGTIYYLYENNLSFLDMGHMIITTLLAMVTVLRSVLPNLQKYDSLLCDFIYEFHLEHFSHKSEYFGKINKTVNKISHYYTKFSTNMMYVGMFMFNFAPTYNNLRNTVFAETANYSMEYSLYFSYPGFKPLKYFASTTIYNCYLSYNCSTLLCGFDLLLFLLIFQVIGHVFVLRHNLENFQSPKSKTTIKLWGEKFRSNESCDYQVFDDEENEIVRIKLGECINHHRLIIKFTDELSDVFGPMLAFNYFYHMIACCLLLLECSEGGPDAVLRYGPLTMIVFGQLIQMSVMFELLGSETEKLKESIYLTPWESMNVSNQRTVCIILHKMQYKISMKALGLAAVGVSTMTQILKTTFSYYAFLQTMGD